MNENIDSRGPKQSRTRRALRVALTPLKCDEGQALVEFGAVAMVFLMLVFGIIDFARLLESWVTVQYAAREGARYAVTGRSDCAEYPDNRVGCIQYTAKGATTGLAGGIDAVTVSVKSWAYPNYADPPTADSAGHACDEVEVRVDYDHHLMTPVISAIVDHVPLSGRERVLNEPFGTCG